MKKIILSLIVLFSLGGTAMGLTLTSSAFKPGEQIPEMYGCHSKNISPPLQWRDIPEGTKSLVLIMDDPDAPKGVWVHWVLYNIPPTINSLNENISKLPAGTQVGFNSWKHKNYGGPCPPSGTHRYFFKLYALDIQLAIKDNPDKSTIEAAIKGHTLASAELMGKYSAR